ncbi:MAG: dihydropteroate synthase [Thermoplasmata archaeon]|jgi:dihydropteroate synthase|nr:dihydropteroate synthase [Thermoplasmata archaeon]
MPSLRLEAGRPLVMGILNATPDSFSDGGELPTPEAVRARASALLAAGADLLDLGGESTRPGHHPVPAEEELARVLPVLREVRRVDAQVPLSIDTRKASVAQAALAAGADLVNDVGGLADPAMAGTVRDAKCRLVLMRSAPIAGDLLAGCRAQLAALAQHAVAEGIPRSALIVDPGLGFGDPPGGDPAANLALLRGAREVGGGLPVLVGASRKRFLGTLTGIAQPNQRALASAVAAVLAAQGGAAIVRVHDVAETVQALRVAGLRAPA